MRKNPIERAQKFHLGKGDKRGRGPLIKSSCFAVIFFRALSLTFLFSISALKTARLCAHFAISSFPVLCAHWVHTGSGERFFSVFFPLSFGQSPCSCWERKRSAWMSNCPQNTMKDWFAGLFRALTSLGGDLNRKHPGAGDGIKMSSLLEKKENCPFSRSPSSLENGQERKRHKRSGTIEKNAHLNAPGPRTAMNIKPLIPQQGPRKSETTSKQLCIFCMGTMPQKHVELVSILVIPALTPRKKKKIYYYQRMNTKCLRKKRAPHSQTQWPHSAGGKPE